MCKNNFSSMPLSPNHITTSAHHLCVSNAIFLFFENGGVVTNRFDWVSKRQLGQNKLARHNHNCANFDTIKFKRKHAWGCDLYQCNCCCMACIGWEKCYASKSCSSEFIAPMSFLRRHTVTTVCLDWTCESPSDWRLSMNHSFFAGPIACSSFCVSMNLSLWFFSLTSRLTLHLKLIAKITWSLWTTFSLERMPDAHPVNPQRMLGPWRPLRVVLPSDLERTMIQSRRCQKSCSCAAANKMSWHSGATGGLAQQVWMCLSLFQCRV